MIKLHYNVSLVLAARVHFPTAACLSDRETNNYEISAEDQ